MRLAFLTLLGLFLSSSVFSQFSVKYGYDVTKSKWQDEHARLGKSNAVHSQAHEIGLAYWFKLKERRVEFHPGLIYATSTSAESTIDGPNYNYDWQSFYVELPVQIYPLDFEGDCNCPTFSKQGSVIEKGAFVFATPAVGYHLLDGRNSDTTIAGMGEEVSANNTGVNVRATIGIGLDLGIGDLITITPQLGYALGTSLGWDLLNELDRIDDTVDNVDSESSYTQFLPAIRLSFRPDYLKDKRSMWR